MKSPRCKVEIQFVPWICCRCGNLHLMADLERGNSPGNCPSCTEDDCVRRAGPMQSIEVSVFRGVEADFAKGEK